MKRSSLQTVMNTLSWLESACHDHTKQISPGNIYETAPLQMKSCSVNTEQNKTLEAFNLILAHYGYKIWML